MGVIGESRRELLGADEVVVEPSSWRLNINEFRLPDRGTDQRHSFSLPRLVRNISMRANLLFMHVVFIM